MRTGHVFLRIRSKIPAGAASTSVGGERERAERRLLSPRPTTNATSSSKAAEDPPPRSPLTPTPTPLLYSTNLQKSFDDCAREGIRFGIDVSRAITQIGRALSIYLSTSQRVFMFISQSNWRHVNYNHLWREKFHVLSRICGGAGGISSALYNLDCWDL